MSPAENIECVEFTSQDALWEWFEKNHTQQQSIWLVTWKAAHEDKYVSRDQVLDVLIAHGWIDGRRMKLDDDRTMQLVAPRQEQNWAKTYKDRAQKLETEGRMRDAGRKAIKRSKNLGKWDELAHVDALEEPDDLLAALDKKKARIWWDESAPSYRRNVLRFIATAKKQETRAKRVDIVSDYAARGEKVPQF